MKLKLSSKTSDWVITIYVVITLIGRFYIESLFQINMLNSLVMGFFTLFIIWGLIKIKFLNPAWFGFFNTKK
ncbi:hypothetical protein [Lutibacter sp.]|uniref:hypothetical protein n=1 Tax=Lutibacter sp. TaxID=1925666 RepID=UPI0025BBCC91|nr:hypothetical protein [Lutibacter sp.]MCF6182323.1 hypothetical protein [Lutibacter sp.]